MNFRPQHNVHRFMRSNHPDVLQAWKRAVDGVDELMRRAERWALKVSGQPEVVHTGTILNGMSIIGVPDTVDPDNLAWHWELNPYKAYAPGEDTAEDRELLQLVASPPDIPGRPAVFFTDHYVVTGRVFDHDGYLYSSGPPLRDDRWDEDLEIMDLYDWAEITADEFHTALDAYLEDS